jgi:type I restriction enzyme M protein
MVRESLRQRFVSALETLGGSAGNGKLQVELGWQDDTYWNVHAALIEDQTTPASSVTGTDGRNGRAPGRPTVRSTMTTR